MKKTVSQRFKLSKTLLASTLSAIFLSMGAPVHAVDYVVSSSRGLLTLLTGDSLLVTNTGAIGVDMTGGTSVYSIDSILGAISVAGAGVEGAFFLTQNTRIVGGFTIQSGAVVGSVNLDNVDIVTNSGSVANMQLDGTVTTLINNSVMNEMSIGINDVTAGATTFTNRATGSILGENVAFLMRAGFVTTLNNEAGARITGASSSGIYLYHTPFITNLNNLGTISGTDAGADGIVLDGGEGAPTISNLSNGVTGVISGGRHGIRMTNDGEFAYDPATPVITELTNLGSIVGTAGYGIYNPHGSIGTLNNAQGGTVAALTYYGALPTHYNIIISSATNYGQLAVTTPSGNTTFGISSLSGSSVGSGATRYQNVLTGVAESAITNEDTEETYTNGAFEATYKLVSDDALVANTWDLLILSTSGSVTATDTQAALRLSVNGLRNVYNLQSSILNASLNNDCKLFDQQKFCLSTAGRYTGGNGGGYASAGALIGAYKYDDHIRIGGWIDQNISTSTSADNVRLSNSNPLFGIFGVWNESSDGLGYEVKIAAGYGNKDMTITRTMIETSEAGSGKTNLKSKALSSILSYGFMMDQDWVASPYIGLRYSKISADGYTEGETSDVTIPLTYAGLTQESLSLLAGVRFMGKIAPQMTGVVSLGVEHDAKYRVGKYSATGLSDLTDITFNPNNRKTRGSFSAAVYYDIAPMQRLGLQATYHQDTFRLNGATNVVLNYQIGF